MKILILTTHYYPDVAATGIIMRYLSEDLADNQHLVTVITTVPHYDRENQELARYKCPKVERLKNGKLTIYRLPVYVPKRKTWVLGRGFSFLGFALLSALRGVFLQKPDVILVLSPPLTNVLTADIIGRIKRTPFVVNVQDIWPDAVVRAGAVRNSIIVAMANQFGRYIQSRARRIVVVSDNMRKSLIAKRASKPIDVVENFCDTEFLKPLPRKNEFSRLHGLDEAFVVLFAGNIGYSQGLEALIEAAVLLNDMKRVVFLIVGNGVMKKNLVAEVSRRGLSNMRFLPFQRHEMVPTMYAAADVCGVLLKKGFAANSEPSKLFSIMAVGRPVIAAVDEESAAWHLVQQSRCGICVEPGDAKAIANSIRLLANDPDLRCDFGRNGRRAVVNGYSRADGVRRYEQTLLSALA